MAASREDISGWFDDGVHMKATHMIVICDTWDHSDYPTYVRKVQDVREVEKGIREEKTMRRVMEVYSLKMYKDEQLNQLRAFNY